MDALVHVYCNVHACDIHSTCSLWGLTVLGNVGQVCMGKPLEMWWFIWWFSLKLPLHFRLEVFFQLTQTWGMSHSLWEHIEMHEVLKYCASAYSYWNTDILIRRGNPDFKNLKWRKLVFIRLVGWFCSCRDVIEYLIRVCSCLRWKHLPFRFRS